MTTTTRTKTKMIALRLDPQAYGKVETIAQQRWGRTVSDVIRDGINQLPDPTETRTITDRATAVTDAVLAFRATGAPKPRTAKRAAWDRRRGLLTHAGLIATTLARMDADGYDVLATMTALEADLARGLDQS